MRDSSMQAMQRLAAAAARTGRHAVGATLLAGTALAQAGVQLYEGSFDRDDELRRFGFVLQAETTLSVRSLSFAGGAAAGRVVSGGGFAPVLALFDEAGWLTQLDSGSAHACAGGTAGLCWDSQLDMQLQPGRYWLVLSQDGNTPQGPHADDGYAHQGEADYTGWQALGQGGLRFVNIDGQQRDGHWALAVDGVTLAVPEPAGWALLLIGMAAIAARRTPFGRRPSLQPREL